MTSFVRAGKITTGTEKTRAHGPIEVDEWLSLESHRSHQEEAEERSLDGLLFGITNITTLVGWRHLEFQSITGAGGLTL